MLLVLSTDRNVPSLSPAPCQTPWFTEGLESAPSRSRQSPLGPLCPDPACSFIPSVNRHLLAARLLCARPWGAQRRSLASCLRAPPPPPRSLVEKRDLSGEGEGALDWRRREWPVSPEEGTAAAASEKASPRRVVWVQSCGFQEQLQEGCYQAAHNHLITCCFVLGFSRWAARLDFPVRLISSRAGTGPALRVLPEPPSGAGQTPRVRGELVLWWQINSPLSSGRTA